MTVLSDNSIRKLALEHKMIFPFVDNRVVKDDETIENLRWVHDESGMSYGLQPCSYDFRINQDIVLRPRSFSLASTFESVIIPTNITASVCDKSSWARRFVTVANTHFDPGFRGVPTIELTNNSHEEIIIKKYTPICQFKFFWLDEHCGVPYNGKYQNQGIEPVPSKRG